MNRIECWDCGLEWDTEWYDHCPECGAFEDEDCGHYDDEDYDNDYEFEFENDLKISDMNLQTLREEKRNYKGLVSVISLIEKSFKDVKDYKVQFTPDLVYEFIRELVSKENKTLAIIFNNRLYTIDGDPSYNMNNAYYKNNTEYIIDNILISFSLGKAIDGSEYGHSVKVEIHDIYVIEDPTLIYKLTVTELERLKDLEVKKFAEIIKNREEEITDYNTYITDIVKYGTVDKSEIKGLKAIEVIRNTKATNKEVLDAIHNIT